MIQAGMTAEIAERAVPLLLVTIITAHYPSSCTFGIFGVIGFLWFLGAGIKVLRQNIIGMGILLLSQSIGFCWPCPLPKLFSLWPFLVVFRALRLLYRLGGLSICINGGMQAHGIRLRPCENQ